MRINELSIRNFRCFENNNFIFDPHLNVIVGNNTSGKTSILHAVQIALGEFFRHLSILPGGASFSRNFKKTDVPSIYNPRINDYQKNNEAVEIEAYGEISTRIGEWEGVKWKRAFKGGHMLKAAKLSEELNIAEQKLEKTYTRRHFDELVAMPVFLAFGADRINNNYKLVNKSKARESRVEKAYRFALSEQVDFKSAFDWIFRYYTQAKTWKDYPDNDKAFFRALEKGASIKDVEVPKDFRELWATVKVTGGRPSRLPYELMSDGFKSMINIVAEIAYRCIMLNGYLGEKAVELTPGVVLIDEIDMYLHPHWQKHVLRDLREAFPQIQFIVTSHSPFIVQSVERNNIITLDGFLGDTAPYQRGIEEIAVAEMGMDGDTLRSEKYLKQLALANEYFSLVKKNADEGEISDAKRRLRELEEEARLLNDPAFEAFLKFYNPGK